VVELNSANVPFEDDSNQTLVVYSGIAYTITYTGEHTLAVGDLAYWTQQNPPTTQPVRRSGRRLSAYAAAREACTEAAAANASEAFVGGMVESDASLQTVVHGNVFALGNWSLCIRRSTSETEAHAHIGTYAFPEPPSAPPLSPPPSPPPNPPPPDACPEGCVASGGGGTLHVEKDPHVQLPYGGYFDFRGDDGALFNLLSAPNVSVSARVRAADYRLRRLLVHGTFFTALHLTARTAEGRWLNATLDADGASSSNWALPFGTCSRPGHALPFTVWLHSEKVCDDFRIATKMSSTTFEGGGWSVKASVNRVYDGISGAKHRLDLEFASTRRGAYGTTAHGLVGQFFAGSGVSVRGRLDVYPPEDEVGEFTTSSTGDDVLEGGDYRRYRVRGPHDVAFAYSRFGASAADREAAPSARNASSRGTLAVSQEELLLQRKEREKRLRLKRMRRRLPGVECVCAPT
jgi:hypothetical protein